MIVFSFKLLNNVRKAIAGRRYPHQLAGGVALGTLLGIVPHGNLLALAILAVVLCLRVNHALLGLVAVAASFGATRLDPYSHAVGQALLSHPTGFAFAADAWRAPLVPWTDLNNTVVLGSLVIGLVSAGPIFLITLPVFRYFAPRETTAESADARKSKGRRGESKRRFDAAETTPAKAAPAVTPDPRPVIAAQTPATLPIDQVMGSHDRFDAEQAPAAGVIDRRDDPLPSHEEMEQAETRIEVIRMEDFVPVDGDPSTDAEETDSQEQPMDEALNYLLGQLRDSQQRRAAG